eukprot:jgi/Tetstr1/456624/TSEL_043327.t1
MQNPSTDLLHFGEGECWLYEQQPAVGYNPDAIRRPDSECEVEAPWGSLASFTLLFGGAWRNAVYYRTGTVAPHAPSDGTSGYCSWNACTDAAPEWDNWCSQSQSNCEDSCEAGMWCAASGGQAPPSDPPPASTGGDNTSGYCSWNACPDAAPEWDNWCSQPQWHCEHNCEHGAWCAASGGQAPPSDPPPASTGGDDTSGYCSWNACADATPEWDNWCSQSRSNCEDSCEAGMWCAASRPPPASTGGDDTSGYCSWNACADAAPAWDNWCSQSRSNCEDGCEAGVWCSTPVAGLGRKRARSKMLLL